MSRFVTTAAIVVISIAASCGNADSARAQVGLGHALWAWESLPQQHEAVVKVELDGAVGTGVVICVDFDRPVGGGYAGYCLTADHVVENDNGRRKIRVTYPDGHVSKHCKVVARDTDNDVAVVWVWVPSGIRPARLAKGPVKWREEIYFSGLGGGSKLDCCLRGFKGKAAPPTNVKKIYADVSLLPGDSGGPVFNKTGEVVGVISGGWLWYDPAADNGRIVPIKATWPARACNVGAIQELIADTGVCIDGKCQQRHKDMLATAE